MKWAGGPLEYSPREYWLSSWIADAEVACKNCVGAGARILEIMVYEVRLR